MAPSIVRYALYHFCIIGLIINGIKMGYQWSIWCSITLKKKIKFILEYIKIGLDLFYVINEAIVLEYIYWLMSNIDSFHGFISQEQASNQVLIQHLG